MELSYTQLGTAGCLASFGCYWSLPLLQDVWSGEVNLLLVGLQVLFMIIISRSKERLQITGTGFLLGALFLTGLLHSSSSSFGIYLAVLAFFHFSEFLTTGLTNPQNLSFDSYLVNHSVQYTVAAVASWIEHLVTLYLFPGFKEMRLVSLAGLGVCIVGECLRKGAMFEAGRNFNHLVQDRKAREHKLVTTGIYGLFRHPSYVGWFLWSVGSQIILVNPLCFLAYTLVSYQFFKERIYIEEHRLISFFGDAYREYQRRVWTGIPGIEGYTGPL